MKLKTSKLTQKVVILASPEEVNDALVDAKKHSAFTGAKATGDAKVGGAFSAWDGYITGKHLELEPGARIIQEWNTTEWRYTCIPFEKRGFLNFLNRSLSDDFDIALSQLKTTVSKNYPIMIDSWLSEKDKLDGNITHARAVTGYNLTGIFCHDPKITSNQFLNNSLLSELWRTDLGYWALIIEQEPLFNLNVGVSDWFGNPIPEVRLSLVGEINYESVTDYNGVSLFLNVKLGDYTLICESQLQTENREITIEKQESLELSLLSNQVIVLVGVVIIIILVAAALTMVFTRKS